MKNSAPLLVSVLAAAAYGACAFNPPPPPPAAGLTTDRLPAHGGLTGWREPRGGWETIRREGETLIIDGGGKGTLFTAAVWKDFELSLEWRLQEGGNSGLFLRAPLRGRASKKGIEIQLLGDHGASPSKTSSGAIYGVRPPNHNATRPPDQWNRLHVRMHQNRLRVEMNGHVVHMLQLDAHPVLWRRRPQGHIGLQDHGSPAEFRHVQIRALPD